jgi:hypothetical protein
MGVDERAFREDVVGAGFQAGADRGYWQLLSIDWPYAIISVTAAARPSGPSEFAFRFELTGYPDAGVTASPWDAGADAPLAQAQWPAGGPADLAFNPAWPFDAVYIPTDRIALKDHDPWRTDHPSYVWDPREGISRYLRVLHELLTDEEYQGVRATA